MSIDEFTLSFEDEIKVLLSRVVYLQSLGAGAGGSWFFRFHYFVTNISGHRSHISLLGRFFLHAGVCPGSLVYGTVRCIEFGRAIGSMRLQHLPVRRRILEIVPRQNLRLS